MDEQNVIREEMPQGNGAATSHLHGHPHPMRDPLHLGEVSDGLHLPEVAEALHLEQLKQAFEKKSVPIHRSSIFYYMGGLTLVFLVTQVLTGLLLLVYFEPTTQLAHKSAEMIQNKVPYGWLVRSLHSWSAHMALLFVMLHMFSSYFMKGYRPPREILWVSGVALFAIMLGMGYTGYLLPDLAGVTLRRFFAIHVGVLPGLLAVLTVTHVITAGFMGSSSPIGAKVRHRVKFIPNFVMGETIVWLVAFAAVFTLAWVMPVALSAVSNLGAKYTATEWARPEWFFLFLSQTYRYLTGWTGDLFVVVLFIAWLSIPWLDRASRKHHKSKAFTYVGIVALLYMTAMTALGYITIAREKATNTSAQPQTPAVTK